MMAFPLKNRLSEASSPYLRRHQHNPVAWQVWNEHTLAYARDMDKPILLSIGYSVCHGCHVMAQESFADPQTAALMNELFINIKVDREERPDLDKVYQLTHSILNEGRHGGWPLTVFLSPHTQKPFFSGTYLPKDAGSGSLPFEQICRRIAAFYSAHSDDIAQQAIAIDTALYEINRAHRNTVDQPLDYGLFDIARAQLQSSYDHTNGGFGVAPKFAQGPRLSLLLRHWYATQRQGAADAESKSMLLHSLRSMSNGGLFDHIAGGFYRYSTDERWQIPHFEKMLYDNGVLLSLYSEAAVAFDDDGLRQTALQTAAWALAAMRSPAGGFYSALGADALGEKGIYYLWTRDEVRVVLGNAAYSLFAQRYGLNKPANFAGRWHLSVHAELKALANSHNLQIEKINKLLNKARKQLLSCREQRVPPAIDDKQSVSGGALMIKGLADGGRFLHQAELTVAAQGTVDFLRAELWNGEKLKGGLTQGEISSDAFLDDYAFLIDALLSCLQAKWRRIDLDFAIELADAMLKQFYDQQNGGFYFTSHQHEALIHRPKDYADEAMPSGNGVAAKVLLRLGHLIGDRRYIDSAIATLESSRAAIQLMPSAHCSVLMALDDVLAIPEIVVLRVEEDGIDQWQLAQRYAPRQLRLVIPNNESRLPGALSKLAAQGPFTAYYCSEGQRIRMITDPAEFSAELCMPLH